MNSIAHSQAMIAAIKDYKKAGFDLAQYTCPRPTVLHSGAFNLKPILLCLQEMDANAAANAGPGLAAVDVNDLLDDAELQKLHEERIAKLQAEQEKRVVLQRKGHGELQEITEAEFLEVVTKTDMVVCHFFHRDFERCKIMDKHLSILAKRYFKTRFIKLSAPVRAQRHVAVACGHASHAHFRSQGLAGSTWCGLPTCMGHSSIQGTRTISHHPEAGRFTLHRTELCAFDCMRANISGVQG